MNEQKFIDWLNYPIDHAESIFDKPVSVPRYERIAYLFACNGGFEVYQCGIIISDGSAFKKGLDQNEAIELMRFNAFLQGVELLLGEAIHRILAPLIDKYITDRKVMHAKLIKQ